MDQGREIFAIPGSPLDPRAQGCNALIKQGALLVESAREVIEVLQPTIDEALLELGQAGAEIVRAGARDC